MKKLWLASIDDTFNPQKDILMGPWCLLGNEHYLNDYQKGLFYYYQIQIVLIHLGYIPDKQHQYVVSF